MEENFYEKKFFCKLLFVIKSSSGRYVLENLFGLAVMEN